MRLSIITVNKDNCEGLKKTVESVIGQSVPNDCFEYIVIDGASKDGSVAYLQSRSEHFSFWTSEPDKGIYQAMNKGAKHAKGDYLLFLNSGDTLHDSSVIRDVLPFLKDQGIVFGKLLFNNEQKEVWTPNSNVSLLSLLRGSLPHPSAFISRWLIEKFPYDETLKISSDWKFWIQSIILNQATYEVVDVLVSDFDCNGVSSQNRSLSMLEREKAIKDIVPERIRVDYNRFLHGDSYQESDYDTFFATIRNTRYGGFFYKLDLFILKQIALFKKSAKFVRHLNS